MKITCSAEWNLSKCEKVMRGFFFFFWKKVIVLSSNAQVRQGVAKGCIAGFFLVYFFFWVGGLSVILGSSLD